MSYRVGVRKSSQKFEVPWDRRLETGNLHDPLETRLFSASVTALNLVALGESVYAYIGSSSKIHNAHTPCHVIRKWWVSKNHVIGIQDR